MNMPVVRKKRGGLRLPRLIVVALLFMVTALIYVWFRISITNIDYRIAGEMHRGDTLLEENRKLKVEIATLKSPRRIESIARDKLGMRYPERDQVIFLR
ncbi:MAG: cell division protein FtsL [Syntrophobacterales bacterium]|nr:MAG: cell division protein FtsL [Syntrophobacterales bacterium]